MDAAELNALHARAQAGEAHAQESLAELLAGQGLGEHARQWLARAVAAGSASAAARMGLWEIAGFGGPREPARGLERVLTSAAGGCTEAMSLAALLHAGGVGAPRDAREGLRWLCAAARAGEVRAVAQLGLLVGAEREAGRALLRRAAAAGSSVAMYALGRMLEGPEAAAWLAAAAVAGHPRAPASVAAAVPPPIAPAALQWEGLDELADLAWLDRDFVTVAENEAPYIACLPDFLPLWLCDYVIGMAAPMLRRGKVVDARGGEVVSEVRSNAVMNFGLAESDFLLELVSLRTARAVQMPPENAEGLGVLHYRTGERYVAHVDYYAETPANAEHLAQKGQRSRTLLVYLNDDFEGGETDFPRIGRRFRPAAGGALIFHSTDPAGRVDPRSLHAGLPPTRGEKWVISKWFRTRALRAGPP